MGMKSTPLSFSPALPCMACRALVTQGLIYQMSSQVWQLLPLCDTHMEGPDEPVSLSTLRCRISEQLAEIQHLQRRKRRVMRAYVRLRREHAHVKAQRALRWRLNRTYKLQAEAMEVVI
jgi:hypothetical protein